MTQPRFDLDPATLLAHDTFVRQLAWQLVQDRDGVDDVVQATWVAALEQRPPAVRLKSWLRAVVRNLAATRVRRETRRRGREQATARPEGVPSADDIVSRERTRARLVEAVQALEEPYRSTILLRFFEGLPPREIARVQDVPVETVRTRTKRALQRLRDALPPGMADERGADRRGLLLLAAPVKLIEGSRVLRASLAWKLGAAAIFVTAIGTAFLLDWDEPAASPIARAPRAGLERAESPPATATLPGPTRATATAALAELPPPPETSTSSESGQVFGTIRDVLGEPIAGASVRAYESYRAFVLGEQPLAVSTSDGSGGYSLDGLPPDDLRNVLIASREGLTLTAAPLLFELWRSTSREIDLTLLDARELSGRVTNGAGEPIAGAWVSAEPSSADRSRDYDILSPLSRTDGEGSFRLTGVPYGPIQAVAWSDGFLGTRREVDPSDDVELQLTAVQPAELKIRTLMPDGETPFELARISVARQEESDERTWLPHHHAGGYVAGVSSYRSTDSAGMLTLDDLPPGRYHVRPSARRVTLRDREVELAPGSSESIELTAEVGPTIAGVVTQSGAPLRNLLLELCGGPSTLAVRTTRTNGDGRFQIVDPPATNHFYFLRIPTPDLALIGPRIDSGAYVVEPTTESNVELEVVPAGTVSGRLVGDGDLTGRIEVSLIGIAHEVFDTLAVTQTEEDGTFLFEGIPPARHLELRVAKQYRPEPFPLVESLSAGEQLKDVELPLQLARGRVEGVVVDPEGAAVPAAAVGIERIENRRVASTETNRAGRFVLSWLEEGHYDQIVARLGGLVGEVRSIEIGEEPIEIEIRLAPESPRLDDFSGVVLLPDGSPAPNASVSLRRANEPNRIHSSGSDENGRFAFRRLPAGTYDLFVSALTPEAPTRVFLTHRQVETGEEDLVVRLRDEGAGSVRGRLVGLPEDHGVAELRLGWLLPYRRSDDSYGASIDATAEVEAEGSFIVQDLSSGWGRLYLWPEGLTLTGSNERWIEIPPGGTVDLGEIEVELLPLVRGRVVDELGSPIAGALVGNRLRVSHRDGKAIQIETATTTDAEGWFELRLSPDEDRLTAWKPGLAPMILDPREVGGELRFELFEPGRLLILNPPKLEGPEILRCLEVQRSTPGVIGELPPRSGQVSSSMPARIEMSLLPPGEYEIQYWCSWRHGGNNGPPPPEEGRSYRRTIEVRRGEEAILDFAEER